MFIVWVAMSCTFPALLGYFICHLRYKDRLLKAIRGDISETNCERKVLGLLNGHSILNFETLTAKMEADHSELGPTLLDLCRRGAVIKSAKGFHLAGEELALALPEEPATPAKEVVCPVYRNLKYYEVALLEILCRGVNLSSEHLARTRTPELSRVTCRRRLMTLASMGYVSYSGGSDCFNITEEGIRALSVAQDLKKENDEENN